MSRTGNQIPTPTPKHHINDLPLPTQETWTVPFEGQSELSSAAVLHKLRASAGKSSSFPRALKRWPERGLAPQAHKLKCRFPSDNSVKNIDVYRLRLPGCWVLVYEEGARRIRILNIASQHSLLSHLRHLYSSVCLAYRSIPLSLSCWLMIAVVTYQIVLGTLIENILLKAN